jgi:hypothetical protein
MSSKPKGSKNKKAIAIFEGQKVRRIWDEEKECWYFSVVDVVAVLIQQSNYQTARKCGTNFTNNSINPLS